MTFLYPSSTDTVGGSREKEKAAALKGRSGSFLKRSRERSRGKLKRD